MNTIGLKKVTFYFIRHKETKQIMPLAKRNRGYSHWNPSSDGILPSKMFLGVPRLLESKEQAKKCISLWFACQNGRRSMHQSSYTGEWDDIVDFKVDNRKKEDLEIIKIRIIKND
jgi:hypothetical protein